MAPLKMKGDLAEIMVAADLIRRGYKIAFPYGEDWDFDLLACREEKLERIQVKYAESKGDVINVQCFSRSLTNGKVKTTKHYTAKTIDWLAVYDKTSDCCYYLPARLLGQGRSNLILRLRAPLNKQVARIRYARDYLSFGTEPGDANARTQLVSE